MLRPIGQDTTKLQERVTLGLTEIWTTDPLPMIHNQVETQFIASQPFTVYVSDLIPSPSAAPVPCWCGKCQHQIIETQTVPEFPLQLGCQTLALQDPTQISPCKGHHRYKARKALNDIFLET